MRILVTGNKGFVGSHVAAALEADGNEIVGLEAFPTFCDWYDEMCTVMDSGIDAVIHIGAIAENQSERDDIYLWNAYATDCLANRSIDCARFIFFSTYLVDSTRNDWDARSHYTWSKVMGEAYVKNALKNYVILRPATMWGDEARKPPEARSVPYRLATRQLSYLFRNWYRNYVHVSDVVRAVKHCINGDMVGTYYLQSEFITNEELAALVDWDSYEWSEGDKHLKYAIQHAKEPVTPTLPGWQPRVKLEDELPKLATSFES